jgi:XapX domain-containing protein
VDILLILKATFAGIVLGAIFEKIKLPLPAPPVFAGVMGILGVLLGGKIIEMFM